MTTSSRGRDLASSDAPNRSRRRSRRGGGGGGSSSNNGGNSGGGRGRAPQADPSLEPMPDIDPSVPILDMAELEQRSRDELITLAERDLNMEAVAGMPKPELIFRILEAQAERDRKRTRLNSRH